MPRITGGTDNDRVGAALAYAAAGWPVFPCQPGGKAPLTEHGFKDASTDPAVIRAWWDRRPGANVAVATGHPGPDVLDVDVRASEGGWPSLNRLTRAGLLNAARPWVATPSGGRHVYFEGTAQRCGSLPRLHLDFKAAGGYVLVPPSAVNGRRYEFRVWRETAGGLDWQACKALLAPAPSVSWPPRTTTLARLAGWVARQPEGNRNAGLFWAACRAIENGLDPDGLIDAAAAAGLGESEAGRVVASAVRRLA
jgi:hypothetical protein